MNHTNNASGGAPPIIITILAALIDIGANRHGDLQSALRSRSIIPMLVVVIAMRVRRFITERAKRVSGRAAALAGMPMDRGGGDLATARKSVISGAARTESCDDPPLPPRTPGNGGFPKVIFQTWKSRYSMPDHFARWSGSLRRLNPHYEYVLWDDADNRNFVARYYPWFLPRYDAYPREIYRADAVRYFFLYQFGGLYADMDTECLQPVDPLFESGDVWLGRMGRDRDFSQSIPNAIMASRPFQEFWLLVICLLVDNADALDGRLAGAGPETMTGPILLKTAYDTYTCAERDAVRESVRRIASRLPEDLQPETGTSRVDLLEPDIWYPLDWSNIVHLRFSREAVHGTLGRPIMRRLFPRSFLVTFWTHSW